MAYNVKLEQFEGPLDLLLQLIDRQKVAIEDIFVSHITEQYLSCIEGMSLDMDNASDFLSMAATLLYIKSRALLPGTPGPPPDEEEEDPGQALIRRLNEYRAYKELCMTLREHEKAALGRYFKLPEETFAGRRDIELTGVDADTLLLAFVAVLRREEVEPPRPQVREIRREELTVADCMRRIAVRLAKRRRISFDDLFEAGASRTEYILTFMALLELIYDNRVTAAQEGYGAKLIITAGAANQPIESQE